MARCLIIGCGCRGRLLARELVVQGHAVRGTTRDPANRESIEAAGAEMVLAEPDRVATLAPAFDHLGVAYVLLGSAVGSEAQLTALHGSRLEMLLQRMLDTTVRGIVYESRGSVEPALLETGATRVKTFCEDSHIPYVLLRADPGDPVAWLEVAAAAADQVLGGV